MAKRVKSDKQSLMQIRDWGHADQMVRDIGDCQAALQEAEERARKKIESIKADLAIKARPLQDMVTQRIRSLEAFAVAHGNDFKSQKSKQLNFGLFLGAAEPCLANTDDSYFSHTYSSCMITMDNTKTTSFPLCLSTQRKALTAIKIPRAKANRSKSQKPTPHGKKMVTR